MFVAGFWCCFYVGYSRCLSSSSCVVVMVLNALHMKAGEILAWDVGAMVSRMFLIRRFLLSGCLLAVEVRP